MAATFPYTRYACPCSDLTSAAPSVSTSRRASTIPSATELAEESAFNPHDPRANYSLYPLENLLFCDECNAIRCARCYTEEVINWYCPNCLFEVPSSAVKSDGNRCSRSCYNCPSCTSPLAVIAVPQPADDHLRPTDAGNEAYMLQCQYCDWSTVDIAVQFNKPSKITEQLAKQRKARLYAANEKEPAGKTECRGSDPGESFANLTSFYKEQLSESGDPQNPYSSSPYSSPANLARIMSLYGGLSANALKKSREKPQPMREARDKLEGLSAYGAALNEESVIVDRMKTLGWEDTTSGEQRLSMPNNSDARFIDQLWPVATQLQTRVGKRCKTCRQFLSRPDPKVGNLRYRIRLLALNNIPRLSLRPLQPSVPLSNAAFRLRADEPALLPIRPLAAQQYILTIRNPIFEIVKITLATPAVTPGKVSSRVTVLCPSFTVGPAGDVWDEALSQSTGTEKDGSRKAAMASLTGSTDADRQPEAGKVWERTRNSTSVIVEIVPGQPKPPASIVPKSEHELAAEQLDEDDDVLEVPVYVRAEWEATVEEGAGQSADAGNSEKKIGERVSKELAYWCVLGVGTIAD